MRLEIYIKKHKGKIVADYLNDFTKNDFQNFSFDAIGEYVATHPELITYTEVMRNELYKNIYEESLEKFLKRFLK